MTAKEAVLRAGAGLVAKRSVKQRPQCAVRAEVVRVARVTPTMVRVTLTGPDLAQFPVLGDDHYVRMLFPRPGQAEPQLPPTAKWYPELLAMDKAVRPLLRNYTLRDVRPEQAEVDVDFAVHDDGGPACTWALAAAPGDVVGLIEQGVIFSPDLTADHLLLVADDTGLPAVHGLLANLPAEHPVTVVVEVTGPEDEQPIDRADVTWLHRRDPHAKPGLLAIAHVTALPAPTTGRGQAWLAGEAGMITGIRRHLVKDLGYAKDDICFTGYFKHGRAQYAD